MRITFSGVPEYGKPNLITEPKPGDVVMYEILLTTNLDHYLLPSFNNPGVVRKIRTCINRLKATLRQTERKPLLIDLQRGKINKRKDILANDGN